MYIDFNFAKRLSELRAQKGVSARDMSLSLGQNPTYIHKIENSISLPSMMGFFYICEYLEIQPSEFFSPDITSPVKLRELITDAQYLNRVQLEHIHLIVKDLLRTEKIK